MTLLVNNIEVPDPIVPNKSAISVNNPIQNPPK